MKNTFPPGHIAEQRAYTKKIGYTTVGIHLGGDYVSVHITFTHLLHFLIALGVCGES